MPRHFRTMQRLARQSVSGDPSNISLVTPPPFMILIIGAKFLIKHITRARIRTQMRRSCVNASLGAGL